VVKRTSRGEIVHWQQRSVDYTLDSSLGAVDRSIEATLEAMDSWSGTVGAPVLNVRAPDAESPKKPGFDRQNGVFFMKDGYAPAGRALAITVLTYDNATGRILDADIIFNGSYRFEVLGEHVHEKAERVAADAYPSATDGIAHDDADMDRSSVYDLHHVVAHELGHSVGMNDEMERNDALMYRYSAPNDPSIRAPADDDIAGLAEIYSLKIEAGGNGCGGATVSPRKPGLGASHAAMVLAFGLLLFLLLRARGDRRARLGFVAAAAAAAIALLPTVSRGERGVAQASTLAKGHASARVLSTSTTLEDGLFRTTFELATSACRTAACPKLGHGTVWGGVVGDIRQEVGGQYAPLPGDDVDVSFAKLPSAMAPLTQPLAGRDRIVDEVVRVLTPARL
jgi:hypothetical protein